MEALKRSKELASSRSKNSSIHPDIDPDMENKCVPVEFFDMLEGVDDYIIDELNIRVSKVRNKFQDLLEINSKGVNNLRKQIELMNKLSPDAYSIANLTLE